MQKDVFTLKGRCVTLYRQEDPGILFLQPVDEHDEGLLDRQLALMERSPLPFALAAFSIRDWNKELSPWEAPPVFGKQPFGGGAGETLAFLTQHLLPELRGRCALGKESALCLGGYSLAGLFALWAGTRTSLFTGLAAASPSVWFPGWLDYVKADPIRAPYVYLSLGDREERAKKPVMASVGSCIREQYELLQNERCTTLEWNPGNHFQETEVRTAKAFLWLARQIDAEREKPCPGLDFIHEMEL